MFDLGSQMRGLYTLMKFPKRLQMMWKKYIHQYLKLKIHEYALDLSNPIYCQELFNNLFRNILY